MNQPDHIMQFFQYDHLPPVLAEVSEPFGVIADWIVKTVPQNPERTVALRKLLEAKDAAVRAFKAGPMPPDPRQSSLPNTELR